MNYSPGPWIQDRSCVGRTIVANAPNGLAFNLAHLAGDDPIQEANARLIAAAPDLIEACVNVAFWLQESGAIECPGAGDIIDELDKVLSKAI